MGNPKITFLGTGNAFNTDGRGSQCLLVERPDDSPFLVDLGPTAMLSMRRYGIDPSAIDRLFLTHLHGDHTAGWPFLWLHLAMIDRRTRPFEVVGPRGTRACLEGLLELCYADLSGRAGFEVSYRELEIAEQQAIAFEGGMELDVFPMAHHASSIGLRFRPHSGGFAISGDTRWCANLERMAQGCGTLILECTSVEPGPAAHVCLDELRAKSGKLRAARIVLVHLPDEVAESLARDPVPRILAAHDGMALPLGEVPEVRS